MANRAFVPPKGNMEKGVCTLFCKITTTTGGTIDATKTGGVGVKSAVRNSAGDYTVTLSDPYVDVLAITPTLRTKDDGTAPAANKGLVLTFYGKTNFGAGATGLPSFHVAAWLPNLAGSAAVAEDVPDAAAIHMVMHLKDSLV